MLAQYSDEMSCKPVLFLLLENLSDCKNWKANLKLTTERKPSSPILKSYFKKPDLNPQYMLALRGVISNTWLLTWNTLFSDQAAMNFTRHSHNINYHLTCLQHFVKVLEREILPWNN